MTAAVAAVSGEIDPLSKGVVYCELVCALQGLSQYDLAEEWTEAMERWCRTNAVGSLHGRCRVHRAEILRLRGACDEAEREALVACEELRPYLRREMGWPLSELGRIRLRKGDIEAGFAEADEIFEDTFEFPMIYHYSMEPHIAIAEVDSDGINIWTSTGHPFGVRQEIDKLVADGISDEEIPSLNLPTMSSWRANEIEWT